MATPNPLFDKPQASTAEAATQPPAEPTVAELIAQQAVNLQDVAGASQMYIAVSASIAPHISTEAFTIYRQKLLEQSGSPSDPMEIMLIEQIALAHFHIGRLHLRSCSATDGNLAVAFADAATRLTAEFRRSVLALEEYRAKQIARKGLAATLDTPAPAAPPEQNGKPPRTKAKRKPAVPEVDGNRRGEIPECLRKRMNPTLEKSGLGASIN
jgi:hypothetical protein